MSYYYSNHQQQNPYYHNYNPNNQIYQTNLNYDHYYPNYPQYYPPNHFYTTNGYYYNTINPTQSTTTIVDDHVPAKIEYFHTPDIADDDDDDYEDMEESHKKHFHGGYDIVETYGKPLPPSSEICYPPSKAGVGSDVGGASYGSIASPHGKNGQHHGNNEAKVVKKPETEAKAQAKVEEEVAKAEAEAEKAESESESEESEEEAEDDGGGGNEVMIRRQIPPGYGIEAVDICEGLFGGYFPCLWKRRDDQVRNDNEISFCNTDYDQYDYWRGTADYLFGNPNPYGGSMVEKGSYGDPVYCYSRYSPQQSIHGQIEYGDY